MVIGHIDPHRRWPWSPQARLFDGGGAVTDTARKKDKQRLD
jgi:hypothetical protein